MYEILNRVADIVFFKPWQTELEFGPKVEELAGYIQYLITPLVLQAARDILSDTSDSSTWSVRYAMDWLYRGSPRDSVDLQQWLTSRLDLCSWVDYSRARRSRRIRMFPILAALDFRFDRREHLARSILLYFWHGKVLDAAIKYALANYDDDLARIITGSSPPLSRSARRAIRLNLRQQLVSLSLAFLVNRGCHKAILGALHEITPYVADVNAIYLHAMAILLDGGANLAALVTESNDERLKSLYNGGVRDHSEALLRNWRPTYQNGFMHFGGADGGLRFVAFNAEFTRLVRTRQNRDGDLADRAGDEPQYDLPSYSPQAVLPDYGE
ncbi:hypothetical protein IWQ60_006777 [Tieghemiomyces parasiticus]|uniref:Uncharacterized protein n=1 Tax=Tieghemiomyces parasiticus TaxID=78921 RepID=A0A9W8DSU0_9FUNG|nr:hypothetical protein IWQ60_006777 [Tieghemiomyces parasiticus]